MNIVVTDFIFTKKLTTRKATKEIIIHCTGNQADSKITAIDIHKQHISKGWSGIGYHYIIAQDGTIYAGRPVETAGAHTNGHNAVSVGIAYVGGLDANGKASDTRTKEQKQSLIDLISFLLEKYPNIKEIKGHRDYSPDLNGNGKIEKNEYVKACPCFDAEKDYKHLLRTDD